MVGIVIAAHGKLGEGFNDAMSLIVGEQEQIKPLNLDPEMSPEELKERMTAAAGEVDEGDGVLFFVDLFGGTPCNVALELTAEMDAVCIAGINLGMLLEATNLRASGKGLEELAEEIVSIGKEGMRQIKLG